MALRNQKSGEHGWRNCGRGEEMSESKTVAKEKWGKIGAPDSQKRKDYLASIRKANRMTEKKLATQRKAAQEEAIEVIEGEIVDLKVEPTAKPEPETVVAEMKLKEGKKKVILDAAAHPEYVSSPY